MGAVNKVILVGNLGADPEVKYTQGGQPVANLRVATSESWKDKDNQKQERTEWHSVTVWGPMAENCGKYLAKGRQVYVEGRLQSREYQDKEGVTRKVWDVVASNVVFLADGKGQGGNGGGGGRASGGGNQGGGGGQQGGGGYDPFNEGGGGRRGFDDDPIPF